MLLRISEVQRLLLLTIPMIVNDVFSVLDTRIKVSYHLSFENYPYIIIVNAFRLLVSP